MCGTMKCMLEYYIQWVLIQCNKINDAKTGINFVVSFNVTLRYIHINAKIKIKTIIRTIMAKTTVLRITKSMTIIAANKQRRN